MSKGIWFFVYGILLAAICGCDSHSANKNGTALPCAKISSMRVKYAKGFTVDYYDGFKVLSVKDGLDTAQPVVQYVLLPAHKPAPVGFENAVLIETPPRKTVCVATNYVAELEKIGLQDSISGVADVPLLYNETVLNRIKQGQVADLGSKEIDYEKLVQLNPWFVLNSGKYDGGEKLKVKLAALHIKTVLDLEYKELEPLARAEWIKFIAAFYNREHEADSNFATIETNYLALKEKAKNVKFKPTVFCNMPFKEIWYMPCGDNYIAHLIADAGGDFVWKDARSNNGLNLNLDYEAVYAKAAEADYWINLGFASSMKEVKEADKKNTLFKAYKTGNVYNNNNRNTPSGGFDFWETGVVNPDKILADLIAIFHPELMPGHQLYYYKKLQ